MADRNRWVGVLCFAVGVIALSGSALAQSNPDESARPNEGRAWKLDEVVVTATRREERLQDVPLSVVAVSGDVLTNREVLNLSDISLVAPSLTYSGTNPAGGGFTDRGIGLGNFSPAVEQSMAVVVDGIVMAIQGAGIGLLSDIERIEVLNGPQGTTFGKNASAGVINIVTRRPSTRGFSSNFHLEYGYPTVGSISSNGLSVLRGSVNLPLSSTVAASISAFNSRDAGNIYNITQGRNVNTQYQRGARTKLLWSRSDDLDVLIIGDYRDSHGDCCYATFLHLNPGSLLSQAMAGTGVIAGPDNLRVALDGDDFIRVQDKGISAEADYRLAGYTLTAITGARGYNTSYNMDTDNTPLPLFSVNAVKYYADHQVTAEVRLASPTGGAFDFVSGLYFFRKHANIDGGGYVLGTFGRPLPPGILLAPGGEQSLNFTDRTEAVFGQGTYHVTAKLGLIGGARYTHGDYDYVTTQMAIPGYPGLPPNFFLQVAGKPSANNTSWKAGLQYTFSPDLMTYASATRGYKGPTPLLTALSQGSQYGLSKPEIPTNYELGVKSTLLNGRLVVNADVFDEKVRNFQTSVFDPTTTPPAFRVTNAGELDSKGVELQLYSRPLNRLSTSAALTYEDAYYGSFRGNACYPGQTVAQGCIPVPGTASSVFDSTGYPINGVSKWILSVNGDYSQPVSGKLAIFYNLNYYLRSRSASANANPIGEVPGYALFGAKLGVGDQTQSWALSLYARNLLDKNYGMRGNPLFGQPGEILLSHPRDGQRLIGLSLDARF